MIFFGHVGITLLFGYLLFGRRGPGIDYRFLIAGSILPDLIDKPVGQILFYGTFQNGRIFAHTLAFVGLLALLGYYTFRRHHSIGVLLLALGALAHSAEDLPSGLPLSTLLWPGLGLPFPRLEVPDYPGFLLHALLHDPGAYLPEIAGLAILAAFAWRFRLYRPERLRAFLRAGSCAAPEIAVPARAR